MKSARNCGNLSLTPSSSCCKILSNIYSWAGFLLGLSNVLYGIDGTIMAMTGQWIPGQVDYDVMCFNPSMDLVWYGSDRVM